MAEERTPVNYEQFKETYKRFVGASQNAQILGQQTSAQIGVVNDTHTLAGDEELQSTFNQEAIQHTQDMAVQAGVNANYLTGIVVRDVRKGLESILKSAPVNKLARIFDKYQPGVYEPKEIGGDETHNNRVRAHKEFLEIMDLAQKADNGDIASKKKLFHRSKEMYLEEKKNILDKIHQSGVDEKYAQPFADAIRTRYERVAEARIPKMIKDTRDKFYNLFANDNEKAEYVTNNIKKNTNLEDDESTMRTAGLLYEIGKESKEE